MSFGTSIGDIISLVQLAHRSYRNCKQAGGQYLEIAREVRNLHSVLRNVRDEAEKPDSALFQADATTTATLQSTTEDCREILEGVDALLAKYHGLALDGPEVSAPTKFWHRWKFGAELDEVDKFRWKIMSHTSTMAVLMDFINLKATDRVEKAAGRVEDKVEAGLSKIVDRLEGFEDMRKAVLYIATKARASERYGSVASMNSVLSLSTYPDDDKEVWRSFRRELIGLGFRSDSLDRHMEILKAYMMKLDKTGVLDDAVAHTGASNQSWCMNRFFRMTNTSLAVINEDDGSSLGSPAVKPASPTIKPSPDVDLLKSSKSVTKELEGGVLGPSRNEILPSSPSYSKMWGKLVVKTESSGSGAGNSAGGEREIAPAQTNAPVRSPPNIIITESPPAYSELDTRSRPKPAQVTKAAQRDDPKFEDKIEVSEVIFDAPKHLGGNGDSYTSVIQDEQTQGHPDLTRRPPRPYAESCYSASEATISQISLLKPAGELRRSPSNPAPSRPEKQPPQASWSESDSSGSTLGPGPKVPLFGDASDSKDERTKKWAESIQIDASDVGPGENRWFREGSSPPRDRSPSPPTPSFGANRPWEISQPASTSGQRQEERKISYEAWMRMRNNAGSGRQRGKKANFKARRSSVSQNDQEWIWPGDLPSRELPPSKDNAGPKPLRQFRGKSMLTMEPRPSSSRGANRKGFMPNTPGGDEPPAPRGHYVTQRDKPSVAPDLSSQEPSTSIDNAAPDPPSQFREEPRLSTPYAAHGGEKFNPFEKMADAPQREKGNQKSATSFQDGRSQARSDTTSKPNTLRPEARPIFRMGSLTKIQELARLDLLDGGARAMAYHSGRPIRNSSSEGYRPRRPRYRTRSPSPDEDESDRPRRPRHRPRLASPDDKDKDSSKYQQAAKAALLAGATEAFRVRNEPGSWWGGEKGKRILTAAMGASGIESTTDRNEPDRKSKRHILEAVLGGLAGNRLINGERDERDRLAHVESSDEDEEQEERQDRGRRN